MARRILLSKMFAQRFRFRKGFLNHPGFCLLPEADEAGDAMLHVGTCFLVTRKTRRNWNDEISELEPLSGNNARLAQCAVQYPAVPLIAAGIVVSTPECCDS